MVRAQSLYLWGPRFESWRADTKKSTQVLFCVRPQEALGELLSGLEARLRCFVTEGRQNIQSGYWSCNDRVPGGRTRTDCRFTSPTGLVDNLVPSIFQNDDFEKCEGEIPGRHTTLTFFLNDVWCSWEVHVAKCPECKSSDTRRARTPVQFIEARLLESFLKLFLIFPMRCRDCRIRFRALRFPWQK